MARLRAWETAIQPLNWKGPKMNSYELKQEARRERLEARAERLKAEGESRIARASKMAEAIPFGQPILIGHHSEGRDRNYRGRIHSNFAKGFETLKVAGEVAARAASVGQGGISSDDPDAPDKLREKLAKLENRQLAMKTANGIIRRHKGDTAIPHLVQQGHSEAAARELIKPDFCGRIGFADYQLTNNNANIRRLRQRVEQLAAKAGEDGKETEHVGGLRVVENVDENRIQLFFPGKPDADMRAALKSDGFRWAPSEGAWQRQLNNRARHVAECIVRKWEAAQ